MPTSRIFHGTVFVCWRRYNAKDSSKVDLKRRERSKVQRQSLDVLKTDCFGANANVTNYFNILCFNKVLAKIFTVVKLMIKTDQN